MAIQSANLEICGVLQQETAFAVLDEDSVWYRVNDRAQQLALPGQLVGHRFFVADVLDGAQEIQRLACIIFDQGNMAVDPDDAAVLSQEGPFRGKVLDFAAQYRLEEFFLLDALIVMRNDVRESHRQQFLAREAEDFTEPGVDVQDAAVEAVVHDADGCAVKGRAITPLGGLAFGDVLDHPDEIHRVPVAVAGQRNRAPCPEHRAILAQIAFFPGVGLDPVGEQ